MKDAPPQDLVLPPHRFGHNLRLRPSGIPPRSVLKQAPSITLSRCLPRPPPPPPLTVSLSFSVSPALSLLKSSVSPDCSSAHLQGHKSSPHYGPNPDFQAGYLTWDHRPQLSALNTNPFPPNPHSYTLIPEPTPHIQPTSGGPTVMVRPSDYIEAYLRGLQS